jgi:hypothetical protein
MFVQKLHVLAEKLNYIILQSKNFRQNKFYWALYINVCNSTSEISGKKKLQELPSLQEHI